MGKEEGWECVFVVVLKKNPLGSGLFRLQSTHFNRVWKQLSVDKGLDPRFVSSWVPGSEAGFSQPVPLEKKYLARQLGSPPPGKAYCYTDWPILQGIELQGGPDASQMCLLGFVRLVIS